MAKQKLTPHILELARRGAEVQLRDLVQEMRYLLEMFPHLRDSLNPDDLPLPFIMERDSGQGTRRSGERKPMTPAERKAASQRMKKIWAARKASRG